MPAILLGIVPLVLRYGTWAYGLWGAKEIYDDMTTPDEESEGSESGGGGISTKTLITVGVVAVGALLIYKGLKD